MNKRKIFSIAFIILAIIMIIIGRNLVETNKVGHVQVKQAAITGEMSVRSTPGTYGQWLGDITDYLYSDAVYLSADDLDGGDGDETNSIKVLFPDGDCQVDFVGQYEVRADHATWLKIKERYPTQQALKSMIRQQVIEVITNTGSLMNAEEAYSSKRADFIRLCREQLINGLYKPTFTEIFDTIQGNQVQERRLYDVALGDDGTPIISKDPLLGDYDIVFSQFNIKNLHNFDDKTVELIQKRKEAKAAQQKAITAKAEGEAEIAKKKAEQEALKIEEVTKAEKVAAVATIEAKKEYEVEKFNALKAKETAKKIEAEGEAQAAANRALVSAGLTPEQEMKMRIEIADKVSKNISHAPTPSVVIVGDGGSGKGTGAEQALQVMGAERALRLVKELETITKK